MDEKNQQIREVYASYGLAMYHAQVLETEAWNAWSFIVARADPSVVTRWRFEEIQEEGAAMTLGQVVTRLNQSTEVPPALREMLTEAVNKRNWLAHRYFWDRCVEIIDVSGRDSMIEELDELDAWFQELDRQLSAVTLKIMGESGLTVTLDLLGAEMADLLSGHTTPVSIRRKLNKTETLVKVYQYACMDTASGESRKLPLFQLSDGSFCSLCDCGLTYGPEAVEPDQLIPLDSFDDLLPAEVTIKPKGASHWHFRIPLGTSAHICVEPVPAEGGNVCRWYIRRQSR
jgi:hypothetical protein